MQKIDPATRFMLVVANLLWAMAVSLAMGTLPRGTPTNIFLIVFTPILIYFAFISLKKLTKEQARPIARDMFVVLMVGLLHNFNKYFEFVSLSRDMSRFVTGMFLIFYAFYPISMAVWIRRSR